MNALLSRRASILKELLKLMEALGFRYVTNIVWVKDRIGLGQYFSGQHELLLFAVKGRLPYKNAENPQRSKCTTPSVITAPRLAHRVRSPIAYDISLESPCESLLALFSRSLVG